MDFSQIAEYRGAAALVIPVVFALLGARGLVWAFQQRRAGQHKAAREGLLVGLGLLALCPVAINPVVGLLPSLSIVGLMLLLSRHSAPRLVRPVATLVGVLVLGVVSLASFSGIRPGTAMGPSMWPTSPKTMSLSLVDTHAYWSRSPTRGEQIEFAVTAGQEGPGEDDWTAGRYHKRVWAVEGDTVSLEPYAIVVNGRTVAECRDRRRSLPLAQWLCHVTLPGPGPSFDIVWGDPTIWDYPARQGKVPPGHLFVLGDNLPESGDSREHGFIKSEWVTGRALPIPH